MTDRDLFAAAALTGLLDRRNYPNFPDHSPPYNGDAGPIAEASFKIADAMLEARGSGQPDWRDLFTRIAIAADSMLEAKNRWDQNKLPLGEYLESEAMLKELLEEAKKIA